MANLNQLKINFLDMEHEEQKTLIHGIREKRRTKPLTRKQKAKGTSTKKRNAKGSRSSTANIKRNSGKVDPLAMVSSLSDKEKQKLLRELGVLK